MKVFVTGATGFIGSHLVQLLLERGHEVRALVRPGAVIHNPVVEQAEAIIADLGDNEALAKGCTGVDAVVHCAAQVGVTDREKDIHRINVDGTLNLIRAAADANVSRVIHLSSCGVLGPVTVELADSNTPLNPRNSYARSKAEIEAKAAETASALNLPLAIVRPPWTYGPGDLRTLGLFRAIQKGWPLPWKTDVRTHPVHVRDFTRGILACLEAFPGPAGRLYILAGPCPLTVEELVSRMAEAMGCKPPLHVSPSLMVGAATVADTVGDLFNLVLPLTRRRLHFFTYANAFSIEEARRDFGYDPTEDLQAGLEETVVYYRAKGLLS